MEPRGALGHYDQGEDRYTLYTRRQGSHTLRKLLAEQGAATCRKSKIRVVTPDVGGGFGMKIFLYPEHVLVLWASQASCGVPVKWTGERGEAFLTDTHGRDNVTHAELALDADGKFLAWRFETTANLGAYLSNFGPFIPTAAGSGHAGRRLCQPRRSMSRSRASSPTPIPVDAYRGAGRPEAAYVVERLVDTAARELGIAPERAAPAQLHPAGSDAVHAPPLGLTYDSGDFARTWKTR